MTSNNREFLKRHFTQINGATIGGPASASIMDIFGAVIIDPIPREGGLLIPVDWKRYRDETWDIEENVDEKDIVQFTEYMSTKVLKEKIKFTLEHSDTELLFLYTKVHLKNGFQFQKYIRSQQTRKIALTQNLHTHRTWRKTFHIEWH